MAFQPVPGTIEAVVRYVLGGVNIVNTFYAIHTLGETQAKIQLLAELVDAWMDDGLKTLLSNEMTYSGTATRGLGEENSYEGLSVAGAGACGYAAEPLPNNCAIALKRSSGQTGRSARGRIYLPGIPVSWQSSNENILTASFVDAALVPLNNLRTVLAAEAFTEVIVSRYHNGAKRAEGVTFAVTEYSYVDTRIDSQRARLP